MNKTNNCCKRKGRRVEKEGREKASCNGVSSGYSFPKVCA